MTFISHLIVQPSIGNDPQAGFAIVYVEGRLKATEKAELHHLVLIGGVRLVEETR